MEDECFDITWQLEFSFLLGGDQFLVEALPVLAQTNCSEQTVSNSHGAGMLILLISTSLTSAFCLSRSFVAYWVCFATSLLISLLPPKLK